MPKNLWLKFGCFLSGYNYTILNECSEASKKYIKKITSALVIIVSIWSMVGYMFASRYAGADKMGSLIGAAFAGLIIIQIERQIVLGRNTTKWTLLFRFLLGLIVAVIGALIIDQVFFKNDIAQKKEDLITARIAKRVEDVQSSAQYTISSNLKKIDSLRIKIDSNNRIAEKSGFKIPTSNQVTQQQLNNSNGTPTIITTSTKTFISHPKLEENNELRKQISVYESYIISERDSLTSRIERAKSKARNEPPGFLDELTIIIDLATQSRIASIAYLVFLSFFILIELFIVLAKLSDGNNDYNRFLEYQERIREDRLRILEQKRNASIGEDDRIDNSSDLMNKRPK